MMRMGTITILALSLGLAFGCASSTRNTDGDGDSDVDGDSDGDGDVDGDADSDGDADGDADGDSDGDGDGDGECREASDCLLACNGTCCNCPVVVSVDETLDPTWYPADEDGNCLSTCPTICEPCPPTPEPACVDGECMPRLGCTGDEDCILARECVCDCVVATTRSEVSEDACQSLEEEYPEGCFECGIDSDCGPCPEPEPIGARCVDGTCEVVLPPVDPHLAPCGGPYPECADGYTCYPDLSDCGWGAYGVCVPESHFCGGHEGRPCPHDGSICLEATFGFDVFGICVQPDDMGRVCSELPACFACDIDSGP